MKRCVRREVSRKQRRCVGGVTVRRCFMLEVVQLLRGLHPMEHPCWSKDIAEGMKRI